MTNTNLFHNIQACIFDMDGTLIDSLSIWDDIDERFFAMHGMSVPSDYTKIIAPMSFMEMAQFTKDAYHLEESIEEIATTWKNWSKEAYLYHIKEKPGVYSLLQKLKEAKMPLALATTNDESLYLPCLKRLNLDIYFDHIANVNALKTTKREPKIYLHLANKMKVAPENTLIFEDILMAVETAKNANFKCVAVYDKKNEEDWPQIKQKADFYINSFDDFN